MADKIYLRGGLAADRPTLDPREPSFDLDAKKMWIGTATGNQGIVSSAPTLATWISPTLLNSWVNLGAGYATAGYKKDDLGNVEIKGTIRNGTATSGTTLFVLPAGYRPLEIMLRPTATGSVYGQFYITPAGLVVIDAGSNTSFAINTTFRAEQ